MLDLSLVGALLGMLLMANVLRGKTFTKSTLAIEFLLSANMGVIQFLRHDFFVWLFGPLALLLLINLIKMRHKPWDSDQRTR